MTKHNLRKEPTFGSPSAQTEIDFSESSEQVVLPKVSISAQSEHKPGYTFTPVMTRPTEIAKDFATFEEKKVMEREAEQAAPAVVKPVSGLKFSPVEEENIAKEEIAAVREERVEAAVAPAPVSPAQVSPASAQEPEPMVERVIPAAVPPLKASVAEKVPSKYRRILVVALIGLALLLVLWLLKPSTPESVEQLQQQGSSLPIEFRPVNEEEAKRAEAEAKALQEAQAKAAAEAALAQQAQPPLAQPEPPQPQNVPTQTVQPPSLPEPPKPVQAEAPQPVVPVAVRPSVIHQSEEPEPKPIKKPVEKPVEKVEKKVEKPQPQPVKPQPKEADKTVKVVDAKPAIPSSTAAVKTKVLTVNKGVTLMQTFRDNQLNIADVNAMSKVNDVVSKLKVGEKVTVKLDQNNRVVEMSLSSGGKFVRQANGSYVFK